MSEITAPPQPARNQVGLVAALLQSIAGAAGAQIHFEDDETAPVAVEGGGN